MVSGFVVPCALGRSGDGKVRRIPGLVRLEVCFGLGLPRINIAALAAERGRGGEGATFDTETCTGAIMRAAAGCCSGAGAIAWLSKRDSAVRCEPIVSAESCPADVGEARNDSPSPSSPPPATELMVICGS